jgi:hypothetical protein
VIDGEVIPFKLRPMLGYGFENIRLTHFAFRRDQIQQYFARNCPEPDLPVSIEESSGSTDQPRPKRRRRLSLSEMTVFLMRRWDNHQLQLRLDEIGRRHDAATLKRTAEEIFNRRQVRTTASASATARQGQYMRDK